MCPKPLKIEGLRNIQSIACGWSHSLAVDERGTVYAFGKGSDGQLGGAMEIFFNDFFNIFLFAPFSFLL